MKIFILIILIGLSGCAHGLEKRIQLMDVNKCPDGADIQKDKDQCFQEAKTSVGEEIGRQFVGLFFPTEWFGFNKLIDDRYRQCMESKGYELKRWKD